MTTEGAGAGTQAGWVWAAYNLISPGLSRKERKDKKAAEAAGYRVQPGIHGATAWYDPAGNRITRREFYRAGRAIRAGATVPDLLPPMPEPAAPTGSWYPAGAAVPVPQPSRRMPRRRRKPVPKRRPPRRAPRPPMPRVPVLPPKGPTPGRIPGERLPKLLPYIVRILKSPAAAPFLIFWPSTIGTEAPITPADYPAPPRQPPGSPGEPRGPARRPRLRPRNYPTPEQNPLSNPTISPQIRPESPPKTRPAPVKNPVPRPQNFPQPAPKNRPQPAARPTPKPAPRPTPKPDPWPLLFPLMQPQPRPQPSPLTATQPQPLTSPQAQPEQESDKCQKVDRRRRRKGQCRQGYFVETANSTRYITWSRRKCQASSRKKPVLRPVP